MKELGHCLSLRTVTGRGRRGFEDVINVLFLDLGVD